MRPGSGFEVCLADTAACATQQAIVVLESTYSGIKNIMVWNRRCMAKAISCSPVYG